MKLRNLDEWFEIFMVRFADIEHCAHFEEICVATGCADSKCERISG